MTTAPAPDPEAARNHIYYCRQYMDNALEAMQRNELGKAGEMLWGSVTQALHAVDAWRGPVINSHRDLMNFSVRISREIDDPAYPNNIASARRLHDNFYVPDVEREEIELLLPGIQRAISQLLALLPDEARNGTTLE